MLEPLPLEVSKSRTNRVPMDDTYDQPRSGVGDEPLKDSGLWFLNPGKVLLIVI